MSSRRCQNAQPLLFNPSSEPEFRAIGEMMTAPEVDLASLQPLSREIKDIASRAANRSSRDLGLLVERVCERPTLASYPELYNVFFRYLEASPPSHTRTPEKKKDLELALISIHGVLRTMAPLISTPLSRDDSRISVKLLGAWPSIWRWITFLYFQTSFEQGYSTFAHVSTQDFNTMCTTMRFICFISTSPDSAVWKAVVATPGVFTLVVKYWMIQPDRPDDPTLPSDCSGITDALGTLLQVDLRKIRSNSERIKELAATLGEDKQRIARLLLAHLRIITGQDQFWELSFPFLMDTMSTISSNIPGVSSALLAQNAMVEVCHATKIFTSTPPYSPVSLLNQITCLSKANQYVLMVAGATDGFTWITQALRAGILFSILKSAMWSTDMAKLVGIVLHGLGPYTAYRSVLRVIGKVLQNKEFCRLEAQLPAGSEFQKRWVTFKSTIQTNLAIKASFDTRGKYSQSCSASDCSVVEATQSFRFCSACQEACYCSKECQQRDWKTGKHRTECKKLREDRTNGIPAPLAPRDQAFFLYLVLHDMTDKREIIIQMRDQLLSVRLSTRHAFVIVLDHSLWPTTIAVTTVAGYKQWRNGADRLLKVGPPPVEDKTPVALKDTVVYPVIVIPNGASRFVKTLRPEIVSKMFGWEAPPPGDTSTEQSRVGEEGLPQSLALHVDFPDTHLYSDSEVEHPEMHLEYLE